MRGQSFPAPPAASTWVLGHPDPGKGSAARSLALATAPALSPTRPQKQAVSGNNFPSGSIMTWHITWSEKGPSGFVQKRLFCFTLWDSRSLSGTEHIILGALHKKSAHNRFFVQLVPKCD